MGACFEVFKEKGNGFTEPTYQECIEIEFEALGVPHISQPEVAHTYKGRSLKTHFRPDFLCYEKIILEIKAVTQLIDEHRSQVLNYLNAGCFQLGLLVNFGHSPLLEYERIALSSSFRGLSRISRATLPS